jgi:hypothetical protein
MHDWGTHVVPDAYCWHVPLPLQKPFCPHVAAVLSWHSFCGSAPLATGPQLPSAPVPFNTAVQAWQRPPQLELQQTPSMQNALKQSPMTAHVEPFSFLQLPMPSHETVVPEQSIVALRSSWPAGMFVHAPAVMIETLHDWHVPEQAELQQTPSTQKPLKQSPSTPHAEPLSFLQLPMPSQEFVVVQLGASSTFMGVLVHVPSAPVTLQAVHVAVHVELQHTPSTQKPLTHSVPVVHVLPRSPLQALAPLHDPGMHSFCGSEPFTMGPHVPFVP